MDARETWLRLLICLEHMLIETERPAASKLFKAQGRRRIGVARKQLQRERDELLSICGRWSLAIVPDDVVRGTQCPPPMDDLADDYDNLVEWYRGAAEIAESRGDPIAAEWLKTRARVHDLQRFFL